MHQMAISLIKKGKEVLKMIIDIMPDQLRLGYALWTRKVVKELIEREFGIVLAITTMGDYLCNGASVHKSLKKELMSRALDVKE